MSLKTEIETFATRVGTEFKALRTQLTGNSSGSLAGLTTEAKTSLIAAINELDAAISALTGGTGGATIADGAPTSSTVWSSAKTDEEITAAVDAAITALVDTSPAALDTLNELSNALGDDPNFATTILAQLADKAAVVHTHTSSQITDFNAAVDARVTAIVGDTDVDFVAVFQAGLV